MTLNVGSLFEAGWDDRRHEVAAWIDRVDPDIVCLQEVWTDAGDNTAGWIVDNVQTSYEVVFGGHGFGSWANKGPEFRFGSAVLSRWPIDDVHVWDLPTVDDADDPIPAMMPWELVHARTADIDVFTTHLAPAPTHGRHRQRQVLEIDSLIKQVRGDLDRLEFGKRRESMPPLLCGDFNAESDSDEIRYLKGLTSLEGRTTFFQDAWEIAGDGSAGYTNDWRSHPLAAALNVHLKRIDYVLVGDPFMRAGNIGRILNAQMVANEPITGIQASDHIGIAVDIEWPTRPATNA